MRINLAAAICWENYMPLLRQTLYAQNINLYLAPTADGRDAWLGLIRTIGVEGRCFVVSSNMCVRDTPSSSSAATKEQEDGSPYSEEPKRNTARRNSAITEDGFEIALPKAKKGEAAETTASSTTTPAAQGTAAKFISRGGSCIANPFGDVLAGPSWEDDEEIIYADVDFKDCIRARLDSDAAGSYSR